MAIADIRCDFLRRETSNSLFIDLPGSAGKAIGIPSHYKPGRRGFASGTLVVVFRSVPAGRRRKGWRLTQDFVLGYSHALPPGEAVLPEHRIVGYSHSSRGGLPRTSSWVVVALSPGSGWADCGVPVELAAGARER